jgi:AcrR family transcriptional regulator
MVQDRGLNAVSFQHLADAVGLSKPTVFHHFKNKEALAKALIERCRTKYGTQYGNVIDSERSAPEKLRAVATVFEEGLREKHLCLLGSLGNCVSTLPPAAGEELHATAAGTITRYARIFEQGREEKSLTFAGAPEDMAAAFLALMQGLQVLARTKGDEELFGRAAESIIDSLVS